MLSWWDESPSWLAACVASLANVADRLVAVDGRYALYDDERTQSPVEQAEAILETATGAGIPLTLHRPNTAFAGNEVEKRNLLLRLALVEARPMEDWLLAFDADMTVSYVSPAFRADLESTDCLSAAPAIQENLDATELDVARIVSVAEAWQSGVTLLYRVLDRMEYEGTHYTLSGFAGSQKVWLWGPHAGDRFDATHALAIRHRNMQRSIYRREQASAYYATRDRLGVEVVPVR